MAVRSRILRRGAVAITLILGVLVGTSAWQGSQADSARAERCARNQADSEQRARLDAGTGRRIAVIGDSYSVGLGLDDLADSWPSRLPGRVHVEGFSGSGFSQGASACGRVWYAARAGRALASKPDVVVVEGGLNDFDQPSAAIAAGADDVLRRLNGVTVVVVGPAPAPSRAGEVARVDAVLAGAAQRHGATYVSAAAWDLEYLDDRLHLTLAGHREFGDLVAASLPR